MDLNEINVFVNVYEAKSFVGAAKRLEMPKSTVSAKISGLEKRLGVTLIRRTTRRLFITDAGEDYYQACIQALSKISAIEEQIGQHQAVPQGLLRITAPVEMGEILLPEVLKEFKKQYPKVNLEVVLTDRTVDLVSEGIDLAIRAGELKDSTLIAKKLGSVYFAPFASPKYLRQFPPLKTPKDLKEHCCLQFTPLGKDFWTFTGPRGKSSVPMSQQLLINDLNLIKILAKQGVGVALLPAFFCQAELAEKSLVRLLPDFKTGVRPVHFVYANQEFVPRKLSAFLAIAADIVRTHFSEFHK